MAGPGGPGGANGGGYRGMNRGERLPEGAWGNGPGDPASIERAYREGVRDLGRLRESVQDNPELSRDVADLMRDMQRIDPRGTAGNELQTRINNQVVAALEQIEMQLRRKLEEQNGGSVRAGSTEPVPAGYANSIAEYFRKLSKGK
jgi:hypothetical protein